MSNLTRRQAEIVREAVIEYFYAYTHDAGGEIRPDEYLPRLYLDDWDGRGWRLAWEGNGPEDWTLEVWKANLPRNVLAEPINSCELGLYPA